MVSSSDLELAGALVILLLALAFIIAAPYLIWWALRVIGLISIPFSLEVWSAFAILAIVFGYRIR